MNENLIFYEVKFNHSLTLKSLKGNCVKNMEDLFHGCIAMFPTVLKAASTSLAIARTHRLTLAG